LRISYDGLGDTLGILVRKGRIIRAEEQGPIIANFDRKSKVVEIEILGASKVLGGFISVLMLAKPGSKLVKVVA
jgi:uncharacterized protein YuzE